MDYLYIAIQYNTIVWNKFEGKILVKLWTQERQAYRALTGELWVSCLSYLGNDISGAHYDMLNHVCWLYIISPTG